MNTKKINTAIEKTLKNESIGHNDLNRELWDKYFYNLLTFHRHKPNYMVEEPVSKEWKLSLNNIFFRMLENYNTAVCETVDARMNFLSKYWYSKESTQAFEIPQNLTGKEFEIINSRLEEICEHCEPQKFAKKLLCFCHDLPSLLRQERQYFWRSPFPKLINLCDFKKNHKDFHIVESWKNLENEVYENSMVFEVYLYQPIFEYMKKHQKEIKASFQNWLNKHQCEDISNFAIGAFVYLYLFPGSDLEIEFSLLYQVLCQIGQNVKEETTRLDIETVNQKFPITKSEEGFLEEEIIFWWAWKINQVVENLMENQLGNVENDYSFYKKFSEIFQKLTSMYMSLIKNSKLKDKNALKNNLANMHKVHLAIFTTQLVLLHTDKTVDHDTIIPFSDSHFRSSGCLHKVCIESIQALADIDLSDDSIKKFVEIVSQTLLLKIAFTCCKKKETFKKRPLYRFEKLEKSVLEEFLRYEFHAPIVKYIKEFLHGRGSNTKKIDDYSWRAKQDRNNHFFLKQELINIKNSKICLKDFSSEFSDLIFALSYSSEVNFDLQILKKFGYEYGCRTNFFKNFFFNLIKKCVFTDQLFSFPFFKMYWGYIILKNAVENNLESDAVDTSDTINNKLLKYWWMSMEAQFTDKKKQQITEEKLRLDIAYLSNPEALWLKPLIVQGLLEKEMFCCPQKTTEQYNLPENCLFLFRQLPNGEGGSSTNFYCVDTGVIHRHQVDTAERGVIKIYNSDGEAEITRVFPSRISDMKKCRRVKNLLSYHFPELHINNEILSIDLEEGELLELQKEDFLNVQRKILNAFMSTGYLISEKARLEIEKKFASKENSWILYDQETKGKYNVVLEGTKLSVQSYYWWTETPEVYGENFKISDFIMIVQKLNRKFFVMTEWIGKKETSKDGLPAPGDTLYFAEKTSETEIPIFRKFEILSSLASLLNDLHKNDMFHGDVKADNLIEGIRSWVLIDYEMTEFQNYIFRAPFEFSEETKGRGIISDLYALFMVTYQLLTGKSLFARSRINNRKSILQPKGTPNKSHEYLKHFCMQFFEIYTTDWRTHMYSIIHDITDIPIQILEKTMADLERIRLFIMGDHPDLNQDQEISLQDFSGEIYVLKQIIKNEPINEPWFNLLAMMETCFRANIEKFPQDIDSKNAYSQFYKYPYRFYLPPYYSYKILTASTENLNFKIETIPEKHETRMAEELRQAKIVSNFVAEQFVKAFWLVKTKKFQEHINQ